MKRQISIAALLALSGSAFGQWADNFNRANGPIGGPWTVVSGSWAVAGNQGSHTSAPPNEIIRYSGAAGGYVNSESFLDVFSGTASQFSAVVIGLGGTNSIMVKIQDQDTAPGFSHIGIYQLPLGSAWPGTGTGFAALTTPGFTSARLRVYFSDADTLVAELDTDFDGIPDQTYTKNGVAAFAGTLGNGFGIAGWGTTALFDNYSVRGLGCQESGDAGQLRATAQPCTGSGPLLGISGNLAGSSGADMYLIQVCDAPNFSASTVGLVNYDTQLFLFRLDGLGVASNDDDPAGGSLQSRLSNTFVTANGLYYLAVSSYDNDPTSAGGAIWLDTPFGAERAPDGPGAASPLSGWEGSGSTGPYSIALTGTCNPPPRPCPPIDSVMGGASTWPVSHGSQTTRLFRDGIADTCTLSAPGGAPIAGNFAYDKYDFVNNLGVAVCVSVDVTTSCTGTNFIYGAAYIGAYNPANPTTNNVASMGSSPNPTANMSFTVPANTTFSVVFSEVTPGAGCSGYSFLVSGASCTPPATCYPDCNGDHALNVNDFICFQSAFAAAAASADCDHNSALNVNDFICFQSAFAAGCSSL